MSHVLIVDDDANTREALAALAAQEGFTTAVAGSVAEARIQLVRQRPDVVLMDLRLPDGSGIDLFEDLEDRSSIETILITGHASVESAVEALRLGASGYVLKRAADTDLVDAVRAVARGNSFISPHAEGTLLKKVLSDPDGDPTEKLTPREREVVKLIAEAYTNKEIAAILNLAEKTVESHRANVLAKLGMRDRVELVRYAIRRGLIEP